jgi:hypothetical protein
MDMETALAVHLKMFRKFTEFLYLFQTGITGKNGRHEFLAVDTAIILATENRILFNLGMVRARRRFQLNTETATGFDNVEFIRRGEPLGFPVTDRGTSLAIILIVDAYGILPVDFATALFAMAISIVIAGFAVGIPVFATVAIFPVDFTIARFARGEDFIVAVMAVIVPAFRRKAIVAPDYFVALVARCEQFAKTVFAIILAVNRFRILDFFAAMGADRQTVANHGETPRC